MVNPELKNYIENAILPQYETFDKGHNLLHINNVIAESLRLAEQFDVNKNMVFAIAAYHDIGIARGRDLHHIYSGEALMNDTNLRQWFSTSELETMQQAIEDHRASGKCPPRSIYGAIVAEADREIVPDSVLRRTVQFGLKKYPNEPLEFHLQRAKAHLNEKYAEGGYLKLYLHSPRNEQGLADLREIIANENELEQRLRAIFFDEKSQI